MTLFNVMNFFCVCLCAGMLSIFLQVAYLYFVSFVLLTADVHIISNVVFDTVVPNAF